MTEDRPHENDGSWLIFFVLLLIYVSVYLDSLEEELDLGDQEQQVIDKENF